MFRFALLIAALAVGLTLVPGSGSSLGRQAAPTQNWGSASTQSARHLPPGPRNWATPR